MAEKTVTVCDVCGQPASQTATIRVGTRNYLKDLCSTHLPGLLSNTRRPKRGRKPGSKNVSAPKAAAKSTGGKRSTAKRRTRRSRTAAPLLPPRHRRHKRATTRVHRRSTARCADDLRHVHANRELEHEPAGS